MSTDYRRKDTPAPARVSIVPDPEMEPVAITSAAKDDEDTSSYSATIVGVKNIKNANKLVGGAMNMAAVLDDGNAVIWGDNSSSQVNNVNAAGMDVCNTPYLIEDATHAAMKNIDNIAIGGSDAGDSQIIEIGRAHV